MKRIFVISWFAALSGAAHAQLPSLDNFATRSVSGQFLISAARLDSRSALPPELVTNLNYVEIQPSLLTVSSERIKQALYRELGAAPAWRGKIHLTIRPVRGGDETVRIVSERFPNGWSYGVLLPQMVERQRFVRALVQSLLMEMANRKAGDRAAEIPAWLSEGLTQQLLAAPDIELIPAETRWTADGRAIGPTVYDIRRVDPRKQARGALPALPTAGWMRVIWVDPLEEARRTLRARPPLTLEELSWPTEERLRGDAGEAFRRSAQLFVSELLQLRGGRDSLRAMIDELPGCYNWQTAFFKAFPAHFSRQLDLEKWWALQVVDFAAREPGLYWTVEESARALDQALRTSVEVRRAANEMPTPADVPLQAVIREWDFLRQSPTLNNRLRDLEVARMRMAPEFIGLLDEYRQVLTAYLQRRQRVDLALPTRTPTPTARTMVRDVVRQLDALDARRNALRPPPAATVGTAEGPTRPVP